MKTFIQKHLPAILCAIAIVTMFLPFATFTYSSEWIDDVSQSINGFSAMQNSVWGYILLLGPAVLIAVNYVKQLSAYQRICAYIIPAVCLLTLILMVILLMSGALSIAGISDMLEIDTRISVGFGAVLAALCYIGLEIYGVLGYQKAPDGQTASVSADWSDLKNKAVALSQKGLDKISSAAANLSQPSQPVSSQPVPPASQPVSSQPVPPTAPEAVEDILLLLERLAKMKEAGVLTEEEFAEKKQKLLERI